MRYLPRIAIVVALLLQIPAAASAGLFRAYLSANGNDANPCTLPQPCRLLPRALTTVADGGEVWIVDSGNFNMAQVNVDKSVTILAIPSAQGSLVATGGADALFVNTPGVKVTLRHLIIVPFGDSNDGIGFAQGAELTVLECDISGMPHSGIAAYDTTAKVTVSDTTLRGNGNGIYTRGPIVASLDRIRSIGNATGVFADAGSLVTLTNSLLAHNLIAGAVAQSGATGTQVVVRSTTITDSVVGLSAIGNNVAKAVVITDGNVLVRHETVFEFSGGLASIVTHSNNDVDFYTHLTTPGYSLGPDSGI